MQNTLHIQKPLLLNRLTFLTCQENKLNFAEGELRRSQLVLETEEKQIHTIQVDLEDLKKLLSNIEGISIKPTTACRKTSAHLKKILLSKTEPYNNRKVFELDIGNDQTRISKKLGR